MSVDIPPIHFPDNSREAQVIQAIVSRDHITPEEVVRRALRGMIIATPKQRPVGARKRKSAKADPITDEELAAIDALCPALKLLNDVTDEQWEQVAAGARRMNKEGFPNRA
jgi:hypothetical protein